MASAEKETRALYGGEVKVDFYPASHIYKLAGQREYLISATGATSMLDKSRALIPWAIGLFRDHLLSAIREGEAYTLSQLEPLIDEGSRQHEIRKEAAASVGSQIHEFAERFALARAGQGPMPEVADDAPEAVLNGIGAFLSWVEAHRVEFVCAERLVYSREHGYVGTTDGIAVIDGKRTVLDYKTSKRVYPEHRYQLAAYWQAVNEEDFVHGGGAPLDQGVVIHFDKETGEFGATTIAPDEMKEDLACFLSLLTLKRRDKKFQSDYRKNAN